MTDFIEQLAALAEKATPGPWGLDHTHISWWIDAPSDDPEEIASSDLHCMRSDAP